MTEALGSQSKNDSKRVRKHYVTIRIQYFKHVHTWTALNINQNYFTANQILNLMVFNILHYFTASLIVTHKRNTEHQKSRNRSMCIKRNFLPASAARDRGNSQPKKDILALRGRREHVHTQGGYRAGPPMCMQRVWESVCGCLVRNCVWVSASKWQSLSLSLPLPLSPPPLPAALW